MTSTCSALRAVVHKNDANLLVWLVGLLDAALLQREVVVKEKQQQMPQDAGLEKVRLQPKVNGERRNTGHHHLT